MNARDIYEECVAIYSSNYGFEEKKRLILEHLKKYSKEERSNARIYAVIKSNDYYHLSQLAQMIATLTLEVSL